MLSGSLAFLVSLYFPWVSSAFCISQLRCIGGGNPIVNTFGWGGFGQIAAVLALALAAGAVAAAVDRRFAVRLPFGWMAIALGIFAVLTAADLWSSGVASGWLEGGRIGLRPTIRIGLMPAPYVGLAGVGLASAGAVAARWGEITRPRRLTSAAGTLITLALIASFALPALRALSDLPYPQQGLAPDICVFACLGLLAWHGRSPAPRLATAAAIGVLVAAQLLPLRHEYKGWPYELWLLVASTGGLIVLSLAGSAGLRIRRPAVSELVIVVGSVLVLVSLFLQWKSSCQASHCYTQRGWSVGEFAGVFALGLILALVWAGRFVRELAIGSAIFVLTAGVAIATMADIFIPRHGVSAASSLDYGALLGFAGAALLVTVAVGRPRPVLNRRSLIRLAPLLAALGLLSFEVAPTTLNLVDILGKTKLFAVQSPFVTLGWLGAVAVLVTLRLVYVWLDNPGDSAEVVRLPLALLALTALSLIHDHVVTTTISVLGFTYEKGVSWEGWVALFLCVLLVACGWIARGGHASARLPIPRRSWRADPGVEAAS
jgi:hypothetical protein